MMLANALRDDRSSARNGSGVSEGVCKNLLRRTSIVGAARTTCDSAGLSEAPEKVGRRDLANAVISCGDRRRLELHVARIAAIRSAYFSVTKSSSPACVLTRTASSGI